jgi:hypothetical protein
MFCGGPESSIYTKVEVTHPGTRWVGVGYPVQSVLALEGPKWFSRLSELCVLGRDVCPSYETSFGLSLGPSWTWLLLGRV